MRHLHQVPPFFYPAPVKEVDMKTLIAVTLIALGLVAYDFGYDWNPKQWAPYGSYYDDVPYDYSHDNFIAGRPDEQDTTTD
jgi:hypothetical protein